MGELSKHQPGGAARAEDAEQRGDYPPMPAGWRGVEIEKAEIKSNSKNTGVGIKLEAVVFGEEFNGRKVFSWINVSNPNAECENIGFREQCDLAAACGIPLLDDEDMLIGKRCEMKLVVCKNQNGDPDNEVKGYRPIGGGGKTKAAPKTKGDEAGGSQVPPEEAPAASTGGKRPWDK